MDLDELRVGLADQERFSPDLDAVRERVRLALEPEHRRAVRRISLRRTWSVAAAVAAVAVLAGSIALVHSRSVPNRLASPPASVVAGTHWELTSAVVAGMPDYGVQPDLTESLYLYANGTSVTTGLCFTRQGNWREDGNDLIFTDQRTLQHPCPLEMQDTAPQRALIRLDGQMEFTVVGNILRLHNTTTTMALTAAGSAFDHPGPPRGPAVRGLTDVTWQLTSAVTSGKSVAIPPGKESTMQLYADGTSTMVAYGCFYQTGRWQLVSGVLALTDQVRPVMGCYAINDNSEVAGAAVLAELEGTMKFAVNGTTLTLRCGDLVATFISSDPTATDTPLTPTTVGSR